MSDDARGDKTAAEGLREQILRLVSDGRAFNARKIRNVLHSHGVFASRSSVDREIKRMRASGLIVPAGDCLYPDGRPGWFIVPAKRETEE